MFSSDYKASKQDLIARLNIVTMDIHSIINNLSSKKLQKKFNYLLYVSSVNDPGQFNNFNQIIDEALEELNKKLSKQKQLAGVFGLTFFLSLVWGFRDANSHTHRRPYPPGLGLLTSSLSGYELYSIHKTNNEIGKLNTIKKIINKAMPDNEKLSKILGPEDVSFRKEFYQKFIQAEKTAEQNEKKHADKSKGSFLLWNPAQSILPQVGFAKVPEISLGLNHNTAPKP
jgi:hypothetical protein